MTSRRVSALIPLGSAVGPRCAASRAAGRRRPGRRCSASAELGAVGGVLLELGAEGRERERLEQVEHHALGDRAADDVGVARRGHGDDVAQVAGRAEPLEQGEAVAVGQVHVEQHRSTSVAGPRNRAASWADRATPASSKPGTRPTYAACASAARASSSTTSTRTAHHGVTSDGRSVTVNSAPPSVGAADLDLAAVPPGDLGDQRQPDAAPGVVRALGASSRARARARPPRRRGPHRCPRPRRRARRRRRPGRPATRRAPTGSEADRLEGVVDQVAQDGHQVARGDLDVARRSALRRSASMPRSAASADLPSSRASTTGSPTAPTTWSVSSWATASSSVAKLDGLVDPAHLDERHHGVEPVGRLVVLGAQRLAETADDVELAGHRTAARCGRAG